MAFYTTTIAGLRISLEGIDDLSTGIAEDMDMQPEKQSQIGDIHLMTGGSELFSDYSPRVFSAKGSMHFNKEEFYVDYLSEVSYTVKGLWGAGPVVIRLNSAKSNLKKAFKSKVHGRVRQEKDTILSYSLFWYVVHVVLLRKDTAFLHAGVLEREGKGIVITGTGGCGKTSTLFKLLENSEYSYLAEDFGIIDKEARGHFSRKPISLYASDIEFGQRLLKDHYNRLPWREQKLWKLKRKGLKLNPMIKVPPRDLMGDQHSQSADVGQILYFVRNADDTLTHCDISSQELADRVLNASMRELKTLEELLQLMKANAPTDYPIPEFKEIEEKTRAIYLQAFDKTSKKLVYIPAKTRPDELIAYLEDQQLI